VLTILLTVPAVQAQTLVSDFSAGQPSGAYAFASSTPRSLPELLRGPGTGEPAQPVGHLFLPPGEAKVGAVIFVPGSGGIYGAMLDYWPKQFNAAGMALFSLDMFGPRGVKSTAEDQSQVPFVADTADAFAALRLLATHPRIDPKRIAVLGTSRGGITAFRTAAEKLIASQKLPEGLRFAAHIQMYAGGCVGAFRLAVKPGVYARQPMLWIHGDIDDYALMEPCKEYAAQIEQAGTPTEFVVIEGARHKFDADGLRLTQVRGAQRTLADCPLQLDIDAMVYQDRSTGAHLTTPAVQEVTKSRCSATGASVQGSTSARDTAAKAILAFLAKVYAP
jgi:dienelactone hydrolase